MIAAMLVCLALPACGLAQIAIQGECKTDGVNQIVRFYAEALEGETPLSEEEQLQQDMRLIMIDGAITMRFGQGRAQQLYDNAQRSGGDFALHQTPYAYAHEDAASLALVWEGTQPDGSTACRPYTLAIDLKTGMEIANLDALFTDPEAAVARMEEILTRDVLEEMNAYVEAADLLPLPRNSFAFDETGLTVFYGDDRYRTLDGRSGHVTFYWHEIAAFIGENSPVYAISRPQAADAEAIRSADGFFGEHRLLGLHEPLGKAMDAYALTDEPDYTANSILYALSQPELRGVAVEIPKYAETEPEDTPISAVRHSRVSWHGLTTGLTSREEIVSLLGEPEATLVYDEDDAFDMMLEPGESLLYTCSQELVLEAHLDEDGVLACVILRGGMPESLY